MSWASTNSITYPGGVDQYDAYTELCYFGPKRFRSSLNDDTCSEGWRTESSAVDQHLRPVDIVGTGHRVNSFARVNLVGLSEDHAMTFIYPPAKPASTIKSGSYTNLVTQPPPKTTPRGRASRPHVV